MENAVLFVLQLEWNSHFLGSNELGICLANGFWSANFGCEEGNGMDRGKNSHEFENFVPSGHLHKTFPFALVAVVVRIFKE